MHTLYTSGREICMQKFGNMYQWTEIEKLMTHFKSTFQIQRNKLFYLCWRCALSFYILAYVLWSLRHVFFETVETESIFLRMLYASLPWFFVLLDFHVYYMQKFALRDRWHFPTVGSDPTYSSLQTTDPLKSFWGGWLGNLFVLQLSFYWQKLLCMVSTMFQAIQSNTKQRTLMLLGNFKWPR